MKKQHLLQALGTAVLPLVIAVFLTTCGDPFQPELRDIKIKPETLSMIIGEELTIKLIGVPSTGILKMNGVTPEYSVRWEPGYFAPAPASDDDIDDIFIKDDETVTVKESNDNSATIKALKAGNATIRAELVYKDEDEGKITNDHGYYTATCAVTVIPPSVTISPTTLTLTAEETTGILTATTVPTGQTVTWTSSDDEIATVDNGTVTAVAAGPATATITAKITVDENTYTATCAVTIE